MASRAGKTRSSLPSCPASIWKGPNHEPEAREYPMSVAIIIPARHASKRFPGKPLAPLKGANGTARTLIERTWQAGLEVEGVDTRLVATDDERIADDVRRLGGQLVMASPDRDRNSTPLNSSHVATSYADCCP